MLGCGNAEIEGKASLTVIRAPFSVGETTFDLDSGTFTNDEQGDIAFTLSIGSMRSYALDPIFGARGRAIDLAYPSITDCKAIEADFLEGAIPDILEGSGICVLTNQGNLALIFVEHLRFEGGDVMEISYETQKISE